MDPLATTSLSPSSELCQDLPGLLNSIDIETWPVIIYMLIIVSIFSCCLAAVLSCFLCYFCYRHKQRNSQDSSSFSKRWTSVTTTTPMITSPITQDEEKYDFSDGVLSNEPTSKTFQTTSLTDATHQVSVEVTMLPVATPAPCMPASLNKSKYRSCDEITDETVQTQSYSVATPNHYTQSTNSLQRRSPAQEGSNRPSVSSFKPQQQSQQTEHENRNNGGSSRGSGSQKRTNYVQIVATKKKDPVAAPPTQSGIRPHTPSNHITGQDALPSRSARSNSSPAVNEVLYENSSSVRLMGLLGKQSTMPTPMPRRGNQESPESSPSHSYENSLPFARLQTSSQHSTPTHAQTGATSNPSPRRVTNPAIISQNKSRGPPPNPKPKPSGAQSGRVSVDNAEHQQLPRSRFLSHPGPVAHLVENGDDSHIYLSPRTVGGSAVPWKPYKELDFTTLEPENDYAVPNSLLQDENDENDYCVPPPTVDSTDVFY
ncbi:PREDICTED: uncharacterized protein LOC105316846 isoform X1 [Amphimedon queenslandica]|uniref:Uncharacterized protein n=1 Tax=Amphimedon queenslandica TaxID=400682 RepID=A0A1X7VFM6_AMPQE|nr:PREDICTED: uncharacterized protein LOC105316846 isoform X1 [Amphimedon queenslandica]|eukprot:XP_019849119.1 PREDICTED: uncharacterized protein LOC105316846 isoform X1 [Amphimedon queenslandica]